MKTAAERRLSSSSIQTACGAALAAAIAFFPTEARATVPCEPGEPCHNNFAEPILMFGFGADAFAAGVIGTIGNSVALGRGSRVGRGWLVTGYIAAAYNLALAATWTALSAPSLARYPDDGHARMQLGFGMAHLAVGTLTLGVTAAAHRRRATAAEPTTSWLTPVVAPAPNGGGMLLLAGQF